MPDLYLNFPDEATARAVLYHVEGARAADTMLGIPAVSGYPVPNFANIDMIGVIYKQTTAGPTALPGWNVNVRLMPGEDGTSLAAYQVSPKTPSRVWG